jgi:hypothetical protein
MTWLVMLQAFGMLFILGPREWIWRAEFLAHVDAEKKRVEAKKKLEEALAKSLKLVKNRDLKKIDLSDSMVEEEDLTNLSARFRDALEIDLSNTPITDAGLKVLSIYPRLQRLELRSTKINGEGLEHLKELGLRKLGLSRTKFTDTGLVYLEDLTTLEELDVSDTAFSDSGLAHVRKLRNLRLLRLEKTKVTDDGVNSLKEALPELEIKR